MGTTHAARESLPVRQNDGPEDRRNTRMRKALRRRHRLAVFIALFGLIAVAPLGWTSVASARPYAWSPGPAPNSGDPTGDDVPDPSPKPKTLASAFVPGARAQGNGGVAGVRLLGTWQWLVRYLNVYPLR
jgi:hypothetical protein